MSQPAPPFKEAQPGDVVTLDVTFRIQQAARSIAAKMLLSEDEQRQLLQRAIVSAAERVDVALLARQEAEKAILEAVTSYFRHGEGHDIVQEAVKKAVGDAIRKILP